MHLRACPHTHHNVARRPVVAMAGLALIFGALSAVTGAVPGTKPDIARADDVTASQDPLRTGWDPTETTGSMLPSVVPTFQTRFNVTLNGQVYAQPLVVGSTVIVATENDQVYGLQAGTGAVLWHTSLGSPFVIGKVSSLAKCTDLTPNIGITGTPAYDPITGEVYMFANITAGTNTPHYYLVGINASTGAVVQKIHVHGRPSNDPNIVFSAQQQMERPGVLVMQDGSVWGAFASHCDVKPYTGFVTRVIPSTGAFTLWSDESGLTYDQAGIWQSGGGIMSDGPGRVFVTSGNGVSPVPGAGTSPPGQLAESVIRLAVNTDGTLAPQDFFSPANAPALDAGDTDFGSGGPVGLPFGTSNGTTSYPHVLVQAGKDGRIFLLNRDSLGGREQGPGSTDADLFEITSAGPEYGHPAVFAGTTPTLTPSNAGTANDFLFYVGKNAHLQVFSFGVDSAGAPTLANVANSSLAYGYSSGSPVVTSNGNDPSSAVIWEVYSPGTTGSGSQLEAYALGNVAAGGTPSPCTASSPCTLQNIWSSQQFTSAKFSIPATSKGWVYVGTRLGHLLGFAAPGTAAPAAATAATFAPTAVSATSSKNISITATKTVTITGVIATTVATNAPAPGSQFTVGQVTELKKGSTTPVPVTFPVTLSPGDQLTANVAFNPAAPGGTNGTLAFTTTSTAFPAVNVAMAGEGTQDGLYPQPSTQTFPLAPDQGVIPVPVGTGKPEPVNITNFGSTTQTVTSVTPPAAPFTATGLPSAGQQIRPGQTVTVQVTFSPASAGPATSSFSITGSSGTPATVSLSGVGTATVSQLSTTNPTVNFGTIPVGKQATSYINVSNTGNTASTVQGASPLPKPFAATLNPPAGLPFNSGADMAVPVTFTPTTKGTFSTQYQLTWTDVNGTHTLTVTLTGKGAGLNHVTRGKRA